MMSAVKYLKLYGLDRYDEEKCSFLFAEGGGPLDPICRLWCISPVTVYTTHYYYSHFIVHM